ncbi:MAG: putative DNA modification/repair radical SAM protein [Butyribacter sp.]|nr:putative DNA modification/repair radical SAM protein [bacterium]MDY3853964.1 putative DNA modification/repair radical SAM protein [Butyribacter sp.]
MIFQENITLQEKLAILSDAAKYDVACTSSGVDRKGKKGQTGNTSASGICHSFSADGRCISLLKILYTNECIYNCKYCINRCTNDVPRATFTPEEVCTLTMEFYRRNYIEGLFLSSGIIESPDYTMELICKTLQDLRRVHRFNGYIHCKAIPGASPELVEEAGWYADRMSVNLELPTARGLKELAPNKSRKSILTPMRQIQNGVAESRELLGMKGGNQSAYWYTQKRLDRPLPETTVSALECQGKNTALSTWKQRDKSRGFVPSGQSTQMIIGATGESDYEIMAVTEALYQRFDLKRVFYSAFINVNQDASLPALNGQPSLRREHRLYQADFLLRYYGFRADELLTEKRPFFNTYLDPKCDWALSHLEQFPVEINTADFNTLLRVPGIGTKSARRIVAARRTGKLDYQTLKAVGVVMKRAIYFITCNGKMMYQFLKIDEDYITRHLLENDKDVMKGFDTKVTYKQLTLFDDFGVENYG